MTLAEIGFISTWILYLRRGNGDFEWLIFFVSLYLSLFILMTGGLLIYHTQLVATNLTTNEHQNIFRYKYLKRENGRLFNPFHKGLLGNILSRIIPGDDSYVLSRDLSQSEAPSQRFFTRRFNSKNEAEKTDLLENAV